MWCERYKKSVLTKHCEDCLTWRRCDPVCFKRHFIWGRPDNQEPAWQYSYNEARKRNEDVSMYFNEEWEGNSHLQTKRSEIKQIYKKHPIPSNIRWELWQRDNFTCQQCGRRQFLTIDHIYPESKGGDIELSNLQTLCRSCNSSKGNKIDGK